VLPTYEALSGWLFLQSGKQRFPKRNIVVADGRYERWVQYMNPDLVTVMKSQTCIVGLWKDINCNLRHCNIVKLYARSAADPHLAHIATSHTELWKMHDEHKSSRIQTVQNEHTVYVDIHIYIYIYLCVYIYVYIQDCLRKLEYCDEVLYFL